MHRDAQSIAPSYNRLFKMVNHLRELENISVFRINNNKKKLSSVSFIVVTGILKYGTKIQEYVHYQLNFVFFFAQYFAEADIK